VNRKKAFIEKKLHTKRASLNSYVVFATPEAAEQALSLNAFKFMDHNLRVDLASRDKVCFLLAPRSDSI
jgi:hypothetical protein